MTSYLDLANYHLVDLLQLIFPAFSLSHPLLPDESPESRTLKGLSPAQMPLRLPTAGRIKNIPAVSKVLVIWPPCSKTSFLLPPLFLLCFRVEGLGLPVLLPKMPFYQL